MEFQEIDRFLRIDATNKSTALSKMIPAISERLIFRLSLELLMNPKFDQLIKLMALWSGQWQAHILEHGKELDDEAMRDARRVGVTNPEKVRVLDVPSIPMPHYQQVRSMLFDSGMFDAEANGLTLEYGIFLKNPSFPRQYWLTHELVHVAQYERFGGLLPCLRQYLYECLTDGYLHSGLEQEAHRTALAHLAEKGIIFDLENQNDTL